MRLNDKEGCGPHGVADFLRRWVEGELALAWMPLLRGLAPSGPETGLLAWVKRQTYRASQSEPTETQDRAHRNDDPRCRGVPSYGVRRVGMEIKFAVESFKCVPPSVIRLDRGIDDADFPHPLS